MAGVVYVSAMPLMRAVVHGRVVVGGGRGGVVLVVVVMVGRVVWVYLPAVCCFLYDFILQLVWCGFVMLMVMMLMCHRFHFLG